MSNIAHPHPGPPPLRVLRTLQGRGIFGAAIQICVYNHDFEQILILCYVASPYWMYRLQRRTLYRTLRVPL